MAGGAAALQGRGGQDGGAPAVLAMQRVWQQLVNIRTIQINALRDLLTEYGGMDNCRAALDKGMPGTREKLAGRLPVMLIATLQVRFCVS